MQGKLLLIGFSCTGKTTLAKAAFPNDQLVDSDDAVCQWVARHTDEPLTHIYEIYMQFGRDRALELIERAETALIHQWAIDGGSVIISLGPGFPLRENWGELRQKSKVALFRLPAPDIYERLCRRRQEIFSQCPAAMEHDNWDVDVVVDRHGQLLPQATAIASIERLLEEREPFYSDNNVELDTTDRDAALCTLQALTSTSS